MNLNKKDKSFNKLKYSIVSCKCGISILPNCFNMCTRCKTSETNITEGIDLNCIIESCKKCQKYLIPPKKWVILENESDMLSFLLLRHKGMKKFNILNSYFFLKTEEHSKRIVLRLDIEKENTRCTADITYRNRNKQYPDCNKMETKEYWTSIVQIRQKSTNKRTFMYLEQAIL